MDQLKQHRGLKRRRLFAETSNSSPPQVAQEPRPDRKILRPISIAGLPISGSPSSSAGSPRDVEMADVSASAEVSDARKTPLTAGNLEALKQRNVSNLPTEASKPFEERGTPVTASVLEMLNPPDVSLPSTDAESDSGATEKAPTPPNVLLDANQPHIPGYQEGTRRVLRDREAERAFPFNHDGRYGEAVDFDELGLNEPPRKKMKKGPKQVERTDTGPPTAHVSAALKKIVDVSRQELAGRVIVPEAIEEFTDREKGCGELLETKTVVVNKHDQQPVFSLETQYIVKFLLQENDRLQGLLAQKVPPSRKDMEQEGTHARRACRVLASEIAEHILEPKGYNLVWESRKHQQKMVAMKIIEDVFYDIKLLPRTAVEGNPQT